MKLIYCPECHDLFKMGIRRPRGSVQATEAAIVYHECHCDCGQSWGHYLDDINAEYGGKAVPIGISNISFAAAVAEQPTGVFDPTGKAGDVLGRKFTAFVIPKLCSTCTKIE